MLLRELRVKRKMTDPPLTRYQEQKQTAQILEDGVWRNSWEAASRLGTKKRDMEKGEDQKGF